VYRDQEKIQDPLNVLDPPNVSDPPSVSPAQRSVTKRSTLSFPSESNGFYGSDIFVCVKGRCYVLQIFLLMRYTQKISNFYARNVADNTIYSIEKSLSEYIKQTDL
jgi:hypothetical protein